MNTGETQVKRVTSLSSSSPYRGSIKGEERCQFLWLCPVPLSYLPLHSWQPQTSLTLVAGWIQLAAPTTAALLDPGKETESSRHTLYMKAPAKHNIQLCCCRSEAGRMPWRRLLSSSDNQCNWAGISLLRDYAPCPMHVLSYLVGLELPESTERQQLHFMHLSLELHLKFRAWIKENA